MSTSDHHLLKQQLTESLDGVRLLTHDFYRRWEDGALQEGELASYAEQYRHFEAALPSVLESVMSQLPEGPSRSFIAQNLADETAAPSHVELFDGFVEATTASRSAAPSPAMQNLLDAYAGVCAAGGATGLGGVLAYEMQSSEVAKSKGQGLRTHYGFTSSDTTFWDVHAELDIEHSEWAVEALAQLAATDESALAEALAGCRTIAEAWWGFLDEREALAPAAA